MGKSTRGGYVLTGDKVWQAAKAEERQLLVSAFRTNTSITSVGLSNAFVDAALAVALADMLRANTTITSLNLESNTVGEKGFLALAGALEVNSTLKELKLANQSKHKAPSQAAEAVLAEALENNHTLTRLTVDLKSVSVKDRVDQLLRRNSDESRQHAASAPLTQQQLKAQADLFDWVAEAQRIAANEPPQRGEGELVVMGKSTRGGYVLTGDKVWQAAKAEERQLLVSAFRTNTSITSVGLSNAFVDAALAVALADMLRANTTITSLNLESNTVGEKGFLALAGALEVNSTLKELKLANQSKHKAPSQAAEAVLAEALENNHTLTRLTVDVKSVGVRERVDHMLRRNHEEARVKAKSMKKKSRKGSSGKWSVAIGMTSLKRMERARKWNARASVTNNTQGLTHVWLSRASRI